MIYEIMTILPSHYADTEVEGVTATVTKLIEKVEGKVQKSHSFGKIKMAYPIERQRYGTYILFYVEMDPASVQKLDAEFRLSEEVLRHLIVARPNGIPTNEFKLVQYTQPLTPEGRRAGERDERGEKFERRDKPQVAEAPAKVTTEEFSNQLDQILDSDIMKNI